MPSRRVIFMGTPDFAVPSLEAVLAAGHQVACVYSQPPRPAGRGQRERPSPVHALAERRGIEVRTPRTLKGADDQQAFAALDADVAVVAAYGLILPNAVLEAPRLGCVNVHASLLPRWRGAAPIQWAILAGDAETGVTIMQVTEGLDSGPILLAESVPITATTTGATLHDTLAGLGARLIVDALDRLENLEPVPQDDAQATYAKKLDRDAGHLDWHRPAAELERLVRALDPWPGAWFEHRGERIKVLAAEVADSTGAAGTVVDDRLAVACGAGALRLIRVQRGGKAPMAAVEFLRGFPVAAGTALELP